MDDGVDALVGFVGAHCDALEPHELIEKVLHEMTPIFSAARMLGDDNLALRSSGSAMMVLLSKALSAIGPPKATPSMSGGTPPVSEGLPGSGQGCRARR